jgi:hypothetical protein
MSGRQLRDFASQQRRIANDELDTFAAALRKHRTARERIHVDLERTWRGLLESLVPGLGGPALPAEVPLLRLLDSHVSDAIRRSETRRADLAEALAELDRDPVVRDAIAIGNGLERRCRSLDDLLGALREVLAGLEAEPHFFDLIEAKYDSFEYQHHFWQGIYYRHRRQARRLVKRHGNRLSVKRFAGLYNRYLAEKEAARRLWLARQAVVRRAAEVEALASRRQDIAAELEAVPEWTLNFARSRIRQHLVEMPEPERLELLAGHPARLLAARRLTTLEARARNLDAIRLEYLEEPRAEAERALAKLDRVLAEFRGPSRKLDVVHLTSDVEREYGLPLAHWRELRQRHEERTRQIAAPPAAGTGNPACGSRF